MAESDPPTDSMPPRRKMPPGSSLAGMNPLALLDGALGGSASEWEPPEATELEPDFKGYRDFRYIDRGGMGAVYSAVQESLERRVAIKILPPEMAQDEAFVSRFNQEARLLARLQHPNIVAIYDFGATSAGHLYIVMEFVEGDSLMDVMKRRRLPVTEALKIVAQVCEALEFAHDRGVIHRDIKPTNILLDEKGQVRVADFGLAKLALNTPPTTSTRTGMIMGTPGYAAPEQRRADAHVDHRADLFSTGATLYELLTGHLPVGVFTPPSKKSGAPAAVDKIVSKALQELPAERYQRAADMHAAIARVMLRLGTPLVKHAIITRPMVSMMSCVIIGMGFIYLLDAILRELPSFQRNHRPTAEVTLTDDMTQPLDGGFALLKARLSWDDARRHTEEISGWEMADFHSDEERISVAAQLVEQGITTPLWIGARQEEGGGFSWTNGKSFEYSAWMPEAVSSPVIITEIQAKNQTSLILPSGLTPDWIEVYNPSATPVDLTGWSLKHHTGRVVYEGRLRGRSPSEVESLRLAPGSHAVIYCNSAARDESSKPAFPFSLEASLGALSWHDPRGNLIQQIFPGWKAFAADASLGCDDDGKNWGWRQSATPGTTNAPVTELLELHDDSQPTAMAVLMLPEFEGRWTKNPTRRAAWVLLRRTEPE